jgi:hypothetical protein
MRRSIFLLFFLFFVLYLSGAYGTTYYVSQSGSGDGLAVGTPDSIADYNTGVFGQLDGDTVYFLGSITTMIATPDSGTSTAIIDLRGDYPGFECSVTSATTAASIYVTVAYVHVTGFTVIPYREGAVTYGILVAAGGTDCTISDCVITTTGVDAYGISLSGDNGLIQNSTITMNSTGTSSIGILTGGSSVDDVNVVDNCAFYVTDANIQSAVRFNSWGIQKLLNSTFYVTGGRDGLVSTGSTAKTRIITVDNNKFYYNEAASETGHVIYIGSESSTAADNYNDEAIISNNEIYCNNEDLSGTLHAVLFGFNENGVIVKNRISQGIFGIVYKSYKGENTTGVIRGNLIYDCAKGIYIKGQSGVKVYINTVVNCAEAYRISAGDPGDDPSTGVVLQGNLATSSGDGISFYRSDLISELPAASYKNNLFYTLREDGKIVRLAAVYCTYAEWVGMGYNGNSLNTAPMLKDTYELDNSSPCFLSGITASEAGITGTYTDIFGTTRTFAVDDVLNIGADQSAKPADFSQKTFIGLGIGL